jgi:hypothetical protein
VTDRFGKKPGFFVAARNTKSGLFTYFIIRRLKTATTRTKSACADLRIKQLYYSAVETF